MRGRHSRPVLLKLASVFNDSIVHEVDIHSSECTPARQTTIVSSEWSKKSSDEWLFSRTQTATMNVYLICSLQTLTGRRFAPSVTSWPLWDTMGRLRRSWRVSATYDVNHYTYLKVTVKGVFPSSVKNGFVLSDFLLFFFSAKEGSRGNVKRPTERTSTLRGWTPILTWQKQTWKRWVFYLCLCAPVTTQPSPRYI